jgi:hypothetical protein
MFVRTMSVVVGQEYISMGPPLHGSRKDPRPWCSANHRQVGDTLPIEYLVHDDYCSVFHSFTNSITSRTVLKFDEAETDLGRDLTNFGQSLTFTDPIHSYGEAPDSDRI